MLRPTNRRRVVNSNRPCCSNNNNFVNQTNNIILNTGTTGTTGMVPPDCPLVCDSQCNSICDQIYLELLSRPNLVSAVGQITTWVYKATNISGYDITHPLVISSSLFGTMILSNTGMVSGETLELTSTYAVRSTDVQEITNVSFVAYGVSTSTPGRYLPGVRVSSVVTGKIDVGSIGGNPTMSLTGTVENTPSVCGITGTYDITVTLNFVNTGDVDITFFSIDITRYFENCSFSITQDPDNLFVIGLPSEPNNESIYLAPGASIPSLGTYSITVKGYACNSCTGSSSCCLNQTCTVPYSFAGTNSIIFNGTASIQNVLSTTSTTNSRTYYKVRRVGINN